MTQKKVLTKLHQVRFEEEIDKSIETWAKKAKRKIASEIQYRMEIFERMLKRGEIKEYENI